MRVYMKHTRTGWGVGTLPNGSEYYKACLKWYLSLNMTPEEVHQLGLREVQRTEAQMQRIMAKQGKNKEYSAKFRVPFAFPTYTAYVEGWALYAEKLGEEMNLYKDEYELMGYYDSEIFRACRLVVDTGLHYYNSSGVPPRSWVKSTEGLEVGAIFILHDDGDEDDGEHFDIRDFHSVVLENGPVPLRILESLLKLSRAV
nr:hypothetical protein BaRGS_000489 [Batillaria attramentaria]